MQHATKKKRGCKWCKAPYEALTSEYKKVKVYDGKKEVKPPKGHHYISKVVTCSSCGEMVRFFGPRLVEDEK